MRITQTSQFKKDFKKQIKRGKDPQKLFSFLELIEHDEPIPAKYKDHTLIRYWAGRRDCHLEPDWILIYKLSDEEIVFERTGSHIDIF